MKNMLILLFFAWGCSTAKNVHTQKTDTPPPMVSKEEYAFADKLKNDMAKTEKVIKKKTEIIMRIQNE
jgi:hypothetical protein